MTRHIMLIDNFVRHHDKSRDHQWLIEVGIFAIRPTDNIEWAHFSGSFKSCKSARVQHLFEGSFPHCDESSAKPAHTC